MPHESQQDSHGQRQRRRILEAARDVCSAEGLGGVSIARLAGEVGMSKSGVAAHFPSKEALQLATVESAAEGYERHVIRPPHDAEPGLERLVAMMEAWVGYIDEIGYRGGCFFAAAANEFGSQPGPVRDLVARYTRSWMDALAREARTAGRQGELGGQVDPQQLAFQLHACVQEANLCRQLLDDADAFGRARLAIRDLIAAARAASPLRSTSSQGDSE